MPELPEVESVVRALNALLSGRTVVSAGVYREKLIPAMTPDRFENVFAETGIETVTRRGKYILIGLENEQTLLTHLRMSGRFQILTSTLENPKFTHAEFFLDDTTRLVFSDQRHFGYMNIVPTAALDRTRELNLLAPEPFTPQFSRQYLRQTLAGSARKIKDLLLDQQKVCGLGNIYASEALHLSRLHPAKVSKHISAVKCNRLHANIRAVLRESIEFGSTLKIDPLNLESRYFGGDYEGEWRVYDREKQPCRSCGNPIRRIVQNGRSSYFCPRCQRK